MLDYTLDCPVLGNMDTREAADYLRLSPATLNEWRTKGKGPKFVRMGRAVRYRQEDLDEYTRTNVRDPSQPQPRASRRR